MTGMKTDTTAEAIGYMADDIKRLSGVVSYSFKQVHDLLKEAHEDRRIQRLLDDEGSCVLCGDWKDHTKTCWLYRVREVLER